MTKKPIFVFLLLCCIHLPLPASPGDTHNTQLFQVLFGRRREYERMTADEKRAVQALQYALYLCIDQYNGSGRDYLDDLRRFRVRNLPAFESIDFRATSHGEAGHQRYTHRGWDWQHYDVNLRGYNFQEIWNLRKQLLLSTTDRVFNFRGEEERNKRESFGALLYYTHILGDHIGKDAINPRSSYMDRIPISGYRSNRFGNNLTVYTELLYHLPRLFQEQTSTSDYRFLYSWLNENANKNRQFSTGTSITVEEYAELQRFAQETLDKLIERVPSLLQNEAFFTRAFGR